MLAVLRVSCCLQFDNGCKVAIQLGSGFGMIPSGEGFGEEIWAVRAPSVGEMTGEWVWATRWTGS
jgi:hypothetical protein